LLDPDDDLACARALVAHVLGATVSWPTKAEADLEHSQFRNLLEQAAEEGEEDAEAGGADVIDEGDLDDEPLEEWCFAELFGIRPPGYIEVLPLYDIEEQKGEGDDLDVKDAKKGKKEKKEKKEKKMDKEKKDKKEKKEKKKEKKGDVQCEGDSGAESASFHDQLRWEKYAYIKSDIGRRSAVDPTVHQAIWAAVEAWQSTNNKGKHDRPLHSAWYWDLRCSLIDQGMLSVHHCWDVCRSSARATVAKLR